MNNTSARISTGKSTEHSLVHAINYIGKWDVSKVTYMLRMFCKATRFNQAIGNWNRKNAEKMTEKRKSE